MNDNTARVFPPRDVLLSIRMSRPELALVRTSAEQAGVPVASYARATLLNRSVPRRAAAKPEVARIVGELGRLSELFHTAAAVGALDLGHPVIAAAMRDLADMRAACFVALGMQP